MCRPTAAQLFLSYKGAGPCAPVSPVKLGSVAVDFVDVKYAAVGSAPVGSAAVGSAAV